MGARAIPLLTNVGKNGEQIRRHVVEIHRLENEADDALNEALAALYDGATIVGYIDRIGPEPAHVPAPGLPHNALTEAARPAAAAWASPPWPLVYPPPFFPGPSPRRPRPRQL